MTQDVSETTALTHETSNWAAHTWRLTLWNLTLARRRLMSKILAGILLVGFLCTIGFLLLALVAVRATSQQAASDAACPPTAVSTGTAATPGPGQNLPATCGPSSPAGQTQQNISNADREFTQDLTFPKNLEVVGSYVTFMGVILLCILAGALIGNEYSFGTQRLALSYGVSRGQLIAAQVAALALLALLLSAAMLLLGALLGVTLGPIVGGTIPTVSLVGWGQLVLLWLVLALNLLAYALIALFLGTWGRSSAAGIAGSLGYIIFESIALPILALLGIGIDGKIGAASVVTHNSFLKPNIAALLAGVTQSPLDLGGSNNANDGISIIPPVQGLLITLAYCAVFIALSYWLLRKRDVTN